MYVYIHDDVMVCIEIYVCFNIRNSLLHRMLSACLVNGLPRYSVVNCGARSSSATAATGSPAMTCKPRSTDLPAI